MIFHSLEFLAFFIVTVTIYWRLPLAAQNVMLLVASYVFYGWVHPWWPVLLLITTVVDYWSARRIAESASGSQLSAPNSPLPNPNSRKMWLWLSIAANLGLLGVYKYFDFFVANAAAAGAVIGWNIPPMALRLALPAGISFYTFQSMSYTIDVYRGHAPARKSFVDLAAFVSFFPHLVAGPIMRATNLLPQIEHKRTFSAAAARDATVVIVWGLFKKLVIADNTGVIADKVFALQHPDFFVLWAGVFAFAIQIYADFSAYTDIARGVAKWYGFDLIRNFERPYLASGPADFWHRWNISLSTWFRDYVFIPLGGSRRGEGRVAVNLMITFLASGIWHGASWNYLLWGAYHGMLLILARTAGLVFPGAQREGGWLRPLQVIAMFGLTCIGWLIFRETEFSQLIADFALVPSASTAIERSTGLYLFLLALLYSTPLWVHDLWVELGGLDLTSSMERPEPRTRWDRAVAQAALCGVLFAAILYCAARRRSTSSTLPSRPQKLQGHRRRRRLRRRTLVARMVSRMVCLAALVSLIGCAGASAPDTILVNGKVFTSNPAQPWAEAVAIRGDRVVAVGDTAAISALADSSTRRLDAGGRTIIPGINDAHQHVGITPPSDRLTLPSDPTIDQIADAVRAQVKTSGQGRLIVGEFSQTAWANPSFTRAWLDAIAPNHSVRLSAFTGHGTLLNSRALALIGIDDTVKDPEGGRYGRDAAGRLDGRLEEYAESLAGWRFASKVAPSEIVDAYRRFAAEAHAFGITSVQLMANLPVAEISKHLVEAGVPVRWRVFRFPMREHGGETIDSRPALPPQPAPLVEVRGMKWILDGTPIERLAFLRSPYLDAPGERGRLNATPERMAEFVGWAYGSEDPLAVHAVGDGAIDAYVTAVEKAGRAEVWRAKRPRIEHGDMMPPDLIARVKAMGMAVVQNPMHFMSGDVLAARVGPERFASIQPMKSLLDAGVPLAIGSDGPMNPFLNIMAATMHPANPKEALTREQAVTAYTAGSAFAEFKEKEKGQLAPGMLADLAVLSADVFTLPPQELPGIASVLTMLGGRIVHETGAVR